MQYVDKCVHAYVHAHIYVCVHIYIYICIYVYFCVYIEKQLFFTLMLKAVKKLRVSYNQGHKLNMSEKWDIFMSQIIPMEDVLT